MSLQLTYTLSLPFIAAIISYALQQEKFPAKVNTIIATCTILAAALVRALLEGSLNENATHDIEIVIGIAAALQSETFSSLQKYLRTSFPVKSDDPPQTTFKPTATDWNKKS